jgi:hypothetical protein
MRKYFFYLFLAIAVGLLSSLVYLYFFGMATITRSKIFILTDLGWITSWFLPVVLFAYLYQKARKTGKAEQPLYVGVIFIPACVTICVICSNVKKLLPMLFE